MNKKQLANKLLIELEQIFPLAKTELSNWNTPFQFLICILLSAQTTDKQVNKLTKNLFAKFPNARAFSNAHVDDVESMVKGVNYFKTKAKHIIETSKILVQKYDSQPPKDLKLLQTLPGVGYKTANVFLNDLYQANQGIAVDTHVVRVARMYGLSKEKDPTKIAHDLEKLYPKRDWHRVNSTFVLYGRYILKAKKPDWDKVVLKEYIEKEIGIT
jgi:endonuclease III